eukprot:TRINITY_DN22545_c0_g1_i1.p1 TRINITY_DN22545_c0_g1~~TRINITY_DN22545_c0_g1_i1.p1  ORF type:complete len:825 (-),score=195.44 TRINITY_DN22545_c0_g1_i1:161-2635(-)
MDNMETDKTISMDWPTVERPSRTSFTREVSDMSELPQGFVGKFRAEQAAEAGRPKAFGSESFGSFDSSLDRAEASTKLSRSEYCEQADLANGLRMARDVMQQSTVAHSLTLYDTKLLKAVATKAREQQKGCCLLLFSAVYWMSYVTVSAYMLDTPKVHLLEEPLREVLEPPLTEVLETRDVWEFLKDVYFPVFFRQTDLHGNTLPQSEWSRVLNYAQVQGAVVMEQIRSEVQPCTYEQSEHIACHPPSMPSIEPFGKSLGDLPGPRNWTDTWSEILKTPDEGFVKPDEAELAASPRRLRETREELARWLPLASSGSEFKFFLDPQNSGADLYERLEYLRQRRWIDKQTSYIAIKTLILNAEDKSPSLIGVQVRFRFSRGGGIFTYLKFTYLPLRPTGDRVLQIFALTFFGFMMVDQAALFSGLCGACLKRRKSQPGERVLRQYLKKTSSILGLMNVGISWMVVLGFASQVRVTQNVANSLTDLRIASDKFKRLDKYSEEGKAAGAALAAAQQDIDTVSDAAAGFMSMYFPLLTYYSIFMMVRLFVALDHQPRLAVVLRTLRATTVDFVHFAIIALPTFLAYALMGMVIFGRRVDNFASLQRAIGTCFEIAMSSEFDWEDMSQEDFYTAMSWAWTFMILVCLILVNMVLAIIMDIYTEVHKGAEHDETISESLRFYTKLMTMRLRGIKFVPTDTIHDRLDGIPPVITISEFESLFPEMPELQQQRLLDATRAAAHEQLRQAASTSSTNYMCAAVKLGIDRVSKLVHEKQMYVDHLKDLRPRSKKQSREDIHQSLLVQNNWSKLLQEQVQQLAEQMKLPVAASAPA